MAPPVMSPMNAESDRQITNKLFTSSNKPLGSFNLIHSRAPSQNLAPIESKHLSHSASTSAREGSEVGFGAFLKQTLMQTLAKQSSEQDF